MTPLAPPSGTTTCAGDGVRFVLDVQHHVLGQPSHAAEQIWRLPLISVGRPARSGVETFDTAVVQWQHVILDCFDQEQSLQFVQLVRHLRCQVVRLRPVGLASYNSHTSSSKAGSCGAITQGVLWRVTAVQPL